jgi:ubiquinone/menaquinone biosynthesis C-methylase UbiE
VVASDLTPRMLEAARISVVQDNIIFVASDAESMAFADDIFDLVTCRVAAHHFPDCFLFVQECARVMKPGGLLLIEDHVVPEDDRAARYIDAFDRLRDPSHNRAYAEYEWRGMLLDAGLQVEQVEYITRPAVDCFRGRNARTHRKLSLQMLAQADSGEGSCTRVTLVPSRPG